MKRRVSGKIWTGSCEPSNCIALLHQGQRGLGRINLKYLKMIDFSTILNLITSWACFFFLLTTTSPGHFYNFFAPPGCLYSSPLSPQAVLLDNRLCGTPLSIMRSMHQAHKVCDSPSSAGTVQREKEETTPKKNSSALPLLLLLSSFLPLTVSSSAQLLLMVTDPLFVVLAATRAFLWPQAFLFTFTSRRPIKKF